MNEKDSKQLPEDHEIHSADHKETENPNVESTPTWEISEQEGQDIPLDDSELTVVDPHSSSPEGNTQLDENISQVHPETQRQEFVEGGMLKVGSIINDKYKILAVLGKGGMGTVYKVEHLLVPTKKHFALKLLHKELSWQLDFKKRFVREVEAAMEFVHENAVQIRDFGETQTGAQYLTMDFSPGMPLSRLIRERKLQINEAIAIARQVLHALKSAHRRGIVHRDLKPDNILIEEREGEKHALVLDFGIAKAIDEGGGENITGEKIVGTPLYMSPEQAGGEEVDARSDLYSIGVILYEMITGRVPFAGSTREIILGHISRTPPAPSTFTNRLPHAIESLVLKALAKDREQRFASAEEFITALDEAAQGKAVAVEFLSPERSSLLWKVAAGAIVLLVVIGGCFYLQRQENEKWQRDFKVAINQGKLSLAQEHLEKLHHNWLGVNSLFYPDMLEEMQLRLQMATALQQEDLTKATSLLEQLRELGPTEVEQQRLASLQEKLQRAKEQEELRQRQQQMQKDYQRIKSLPQAQQFQEWQEFLSNYPYSQYAGEIEKILQQIKANLEYERIQSLPEQKQLKEWQNFLTVYPHSLHRHDVEKRITQLTITQEYQQIQSLSREKQLPAWKKFLSQYPYSSYSTEVKEKVRRLEAENEYQRILSLPKQQQLPEWQKFLSNYSDSPLVEKVHKLLRSSEKTDYQRILSLSIKQQLDAWPNFLKRYPNSSRKAQVTELLKQLQEYRRINKLPSGQRLQRLSEYLQQYPKSPYRPLIEQSIQRLKHKRNRYLQHLAKQGVMAAKRKLWPKAQKKLEQFFQGQGDEHLPKKYALIAGRYLGQAYYHQQAWQQAKEWLTKISHPENQAYLGLIAYHLNQDQQALSALSHLWEKMSDISLKKEIVSALLDLYMHKFPNRQAQLYPLLQQALVLFPGREVYYKKLAQTAVEMNKKQQAIKYYQQYLQKISEQGRQDKDAVNELLALQDFYPLAKGYWWKYRSTIDITFRITAENNDTFTIQDESEQGVYTNTITQQGSFIVNGKEKILPVPVTLSSQWERPRYQMQVSNFSVAVTTPAGQFDCLEVTGVAYLNNSKVIKEYYAPGVGQVKSEHYQDGVLRYQRLLLDYQTQK